MFDLGGLRLDVIHTPGHCSGSICLFEPTHGLLVSGDTIMANGIVGSVLMSGDVSDYIESMQRLSRLRVNTLLPGHGRISYRGHDDIELGIARLRDPLEDSHTLFGALRETGKGFDEVVRALRDLNL